MAGKGEKSGRGGRLGKKVGKGVGGIGGKKRLVEGQYSWAEGGRVLAGNEANGWELYENLVECDEGWENDEVIVVEACRDGKGVKKVWVRESVDRVIEMMEAEGVKEEFGEKTKEDVAMSLGNGKNTEGKGLGDSKHAEGEGKGKEVEVGKEVGAKEERKALGRMEKWGEDDVREMVGGGLEVNGKIMKGIWREEYEKGKMGKVMMGTEERDEVR